MNYYYRVVMWSCVFSVFAHNIIKAIVEVPGYAKLSRSLRPSSIFQGCGFLSTTCVGLCTISKFVYAERTCPISGFYGAISISVS